MYATRFKSSRRYTTSEMIREKTAHIRYMQEVLNGKHKKEVNNCNAVGKYYHRWIKSVYEETKPITKSVKKRLNKLKQTCNNL